MSGGVFWRQRREVVSVVSDVERHELGLFMFSRSPNSTAVSNRLTKLCVVHKLTKHA